MLLSKTKYSENRKSIKRIERLLWRIEDSKK